MYLNEWLRRLHVFERNKKCYFSLQKQTKTQHKLQKIFSLGQKLACNGRIKDFQLKENQKEKIIRKRGEVSFKRKIIFNNNGKGFQE